MLGAVSESVVGAPVIRAYGVQARPRHRVTRIDEAKSAQTQGPDQGGDRRYSSGELTTALANSAVIVIGVLLGVDGRLTAGRLIGFLFLVTLFVQPVQVATEVLNEAQNAIAGLRRVLGVLDTPTDVADPVPGLRAAARARWRSSFEHVVVRLPRRARRAARRRPRDRAAEPGRHRRARPAAARPRSPSC